MVLAAEVDAALTVGVTFRPTYSYKMGITRAFCANLQIVK
ncbi:hypothetical protein SAMN04487918_10746 [Bacillus sp. bc15]|nr:hypothetical protein SAMN04487918_10746 [Bacillus sp. bc15]